MIQYRKDSKDLLGPFYGEFLSGWDTLLAHFTIAHHQ